MRLPALAALALAACFSGPVVTSTSYPRTAELGVGQLYVAVDRVVERHRTLYFQAGASEDLGEETRRLGFVEIDLETARCSWRKQRPAAAPAAPGWRALDDGELARLGIERAEAELIHRASGRRVQASRGRPLLVDGAIAVEDDRVGVWRVLDPERWQTRRTIAFPLGELAAIAPGKAIFSSPLGAITFANADNAAPVRGVIPASALDHWWAAKVPLAPGSGSATTDLGYTVRVVAGRAGKLALEAARAGVIKRYDIAPPVVHFAGTDLVAGASTLIDVAAEKTVSLAGVRDVLAYRNSVPTYYLRLASGEVWYAGIGIDTAKPLAVSLGELVAVRGTRWVFHDRGNDIVYIHDLADGSWRWRAYGACMPPRVRDG